MQLTDPLPIRSPLNPQSSTPDFNYKSPLSADGADFPCKGYQHDPFSASASYVPGQLYALQLSGTATHGGGSCQVSLSYDEGQTFRVIKSIQGGCPLSGHYSFVIPREAPPGPALLAWTWFNKVGNREMYMNCAQITVLEASGPRRQRSIIGRQVPQDPLKDRPIMFVANVNGAGNCTTTEGQEVRFPLPGAEAEGDVSGPGYICQSSAPFLLHPGPNAESKEEIDMPLWQPVIELSLVDI